MKKYYSVWVESKSGQVFHNPLKLSELHLLAKLLKENKSAEINIVECDLRTYKFFFN
jgi:hypothetical protein